MDWIDEFLDAWEAVENTVDWRTAQPFTDDAVNPYYYDLVIDKVLKAIDSIDLSRVDPKSLFCGPVNARAELVVLLAYAKIYKIKKRDRMRILKFFYKILKSYSPSDPFTYHGTNLVYSARDISQLVKKTKWQKADNQIAKEIGKLSVSLASLGYTLYTDMGVSLSGEYHGPYDVSKFFGRGYVLFVREYFNLKPVELWPHTRKYRYKTVTIFTVYKNVRIRCDYYGNITHKQSLIDGLKFYTIRANGKQLKGVVKIRTLREYLSKLVLEQSRIVNRMNLEQVKKKFQAIELYQYRNVFPRAGMDWKPSRGILKRIRDKPLRKKGIVWGQDKVHTPEEIKRLRRIMDPRIDYYPKW